MSEAGPFDLAGHVAVVTGGNSGIGLGMADALARAGADVAIWGRNVERNAEACEQLARHGRRVLAVACDVSDEREVDEAMERTVSALGRVDSCFANAGTAPDGKPFLELPLAEFQRVMRVNLEGAFLTFQRAARQMVKQGGGSLVGIASLAAVEGQARGQHYAASKAGMVAMVRACAVELARYGIRANAVLPGWIDTPMTRDFYREGAVAERVLPRVPFRRWGVPADLGGIAVYLASPASSYHTGDTLIIDGGYRIY